MATETTPISAGAWSPDIYTFPPGDVIPEALILSTSSVLGSIEGDAPAVRVAYVDDAEADFYDEGTVIDEADPGLDEVLVYTRKVAQLVHLSREQYTQEGTAASLGASVERAVTRKANEAYLQQPAPSAPGAGAPAGLLEVEGVVDAGTVEADLDAVADAIATVETNGAVPTHILASPTAWSELRKLKTASDSNASLIGAGTNDAERLLFSIPVLVTPAMPADGLLVLDKAAVVSAVGQVVVATSEHVYFTSDGIAMRATFRFGQNVVRPDRLAKLTVASSSGS